MQNTTRRNRHLASGWRDNSVSILRQSCIDLENFLNGRRSNGACDTKTRIGWQTGEALPVRITGFNQLKKHLRRNALTIASEPTLATSQPGIAPPPPPELGVDGGGVVGVDGGGVVGGGVVIAAESDSVIALPAEVTLRNAALPVSAT